jgi:hypothetical protein
VYVGSSSIPNVLYTTKKPKSAARAKPLDTPTADAAPVPVADAAVPAAVPVIDATAVPLAEPEADIVVLERLPPVPASDCGLTFDAAFSDAAM